MTWATDGTPPRASGARTVELGSPPSPFSLESPGSPPPLDSLASSPRSPPPRAPASPQLIQLESVPRVTTVSATAPASSLVALPWPGAYVHEYARFLGMHLPAEAHLLWIAERALWEPDWPDWSRCTESGWHVHPSGARTPGHPIDLYYREMLRRHRSACAPSPRAWPVPPP